jgi:hypothetical protein
MAFMMTQPKITVCVKENREEGRQCIIDAIARFNYNAENKIYTTFEIPKQELKKVAIDFSSKKIRGSYRFIQRTYDFTTDKLIEEMARNDVRHWVFDSNEISIEE